MARVKKRILWCLIAAVCLLLSLVCLLAIRYRTQTAPPSSGSTAGWTASRGNGGNLLLKSDKGASLSLVRAFDQAAVGDDRVFYIEDSTLYSINVDGSGVFRIASGCESEAHHSWHSVFEYSDDPEQMLCIGYYEGYVYVVRDGRLIRYANGSRRAEVVSRRMMDTFVISEYGVLRAYDLYGTLYDAHADRFDYDLLYELNLN